jgi:2-hydroxychromene-2-carboxylate isomerase
MAVRIETTLHTDAACPWAYSESPALRVIEWRYGDQLDWRLVVIGLSESAQRYLDRGYTPLRAARGQLNYRRFGMPFAPQPKARVAASARACRTLVAARLARPGSEWLGLRALQLAQFTTPLVLDDDERVTQVVAAATGLDAALLRGLLDSPEVTELYERDRREARSAAGGPAELQGKTATTDGPVRYTAPSVILERDGRRMEAGGFQPVQAYDVLIANLAPDIERRGVPADPADLLDVFPHGLTTQEVAALLAEGNDAPDRAAAELAMLDLVAAGRAARTAAGDGVLWAAPEQAGWFRSVQREACAGEAAIAS